MSESLVITIVMVSLAVAGIIITIVGFLRTRQFLATALRVPGTITDVTSRVSRDRDSGRRRRVYSPVFSFVGPDGQEHTLTSSVRSTSQPNVGEPVTILVPPDNPQKARIDSFFSAWGPPVIMVFVTVAFAIVSVILISTSLR